MPETPKGNIGTYYEGLKNSERKPGSKTPFVATVTEDGRKKRRSLKVVDYKTKDTTEIETNDRILRSIGTGGGHLAIVTLPNDDRNRIEANLVSFFVFFFDFAIIFNLHTFFSVGYCFCQPQDSFSFWY